MRAYLVVSGTIFVLFAAMHFFITYEHWRTPEYGLWHVLSPPVIGIVSAALTIWAFRLTRSAAAAPPQPGR